MRRFLLTTLIAMLVIPLFYFPFPSIEASSESESAPFTPHEVKVLVVSPANVYLKGAHYLISDLARYGFNVTQHTSDDSKVDYRLDPKTSDLSQYDVVVLHGSHIGYPPSRVSMEEVNHFTNYGGILIVIGNALFANESSQTWPYFWDNLFVSTPVQKMEQRLGVDFTATLGDNDGTFILTDGTFKGPSSLSYAASSVNVNYQLYLSLKEAREIYSFITVTGKATSGVTNYKNPTGATGIYIQGSFIYAREEPTGSRQIRYFGLTDISKRSSLLASLIAQALGADINTIIKPQPLASIRLDYLGGRGWPESYLNVSLLNFHSTVGEYGIIPTIAFTDAPDFYPKYWQKTVPNILSQLKGKYRDWEYSSSLRYRNSSSMMQSEIEVLIRDIKGNFTALGMDQFSTIATFAGYWNQTTLDAMASENLHLLDMSGHPEISGLGKYFLDWWNLRVVPALTSNVVVHSAAMMGWWGEAENFTQIDSNPNVAKSILRFEYSKDRDKWALAVVNGFPAFAYGVWNFRRNEVGTYSLQTVYANLTSEVPDIQFVPLVEAGLYFGNKWMRIENSSRVGSTIEFDIDSSAVPEVVSIGKGMLWLRVNANETIREVLIDGKPWYYFDDYSIRLPANNVHVKVTLGDRITPTVARTVYKVVNTTWDIKSFDVTATSMPGYNITIRLLVPEVGAFVGDQWNVFCSEPQDKWGYGFDASSRVLLFWAISDGSVTFQAGPDVVPPVIWQIDLSSIDYHVNVTVTANVTDLQTDIGDAILGYSISSDWINVTMVPEGGLYFAEIPALPYGTVVHYRLYVSDNVGNWRVTGNFSYNVTDSIPPHVETTEWGPVSPSVGESVFVRVSVSEPENASGVRDVWLGYFLDGDIGTFDWVEMTLEDDFWWAYIPGQSGGREVTFFVSAYDNAENVNKTRNISYTVTGTDTSVLPMAVLLIGVPATVVAIGTIIYFVKFRKAKQKITHEPK